MARGPFSNFLSRVPDRRSRRPKRAALRQEDADHAACQHPAPIGKGPDGQRENDFGNPLGHEEDNQQQRQRRDPDSRIASGSAFDASWTDIASAIQFSTVYDPPLFEAARVNI